MKISSIYIDGFGIFHQESLTGLERGLVLFQGNNETGKSTLLGYIRSILFGFPRANSRDPNYPPLAGGNHGGRIGLVANNGDEFIIERKPGKSGGLVTVSGPDGSTGTDELLQQLLGGVTYEVFKNIYAFSLAELQAIDTLRDESVKSLIYGASAGTAMLALPKANKSIKDRLDDLFKPGGSKPYINKKMAELDNIRSKLRDASQKIGQYDQVCGQLKDKEEEIQRLRHDQVRIRRDKEMFGSYARLWPEWLSLQQSEKELQQPEEVIESFPENGISRLEKELETLQSHQKRFNELQEEFRQLSKEAEGLSVDEAILNQKDAILLLYKKREEYDEKRKILPLKEQGKKALEVDIRGLIGNLGQDWTEEKAFSIDRSLFTREEIRRQEEELSRLDRKLETANKILSDRKGSIR